MNSVPNVISTIDLGDAIDPTHDLLTGDAWGKSVRQSLNLDEIDRGDEVVEVRIPKWVMAMTSSFARGLLQESITALGEETFRERYVFRFEGYDFSDIVDEAILRALRPLHRPERRVA